MSPSAGNRVVCYCDDCQAFAHYLGRAKEVLDASGGSDIFQTVPAKLQITEGAENLRCLRLSGKGMVRWFTGCCKTPVANGMPWQRAPFAGVLSAFMDRAEDGTSPETAIGPVRIRCMAQFATGPVPPGSFNRIPTSKILGLLGAMARWTVMGLHNPSPFFNAKTGKLVAEPYVLMTLEREALRAFCRPAKAAVKPTP